MQERKYVEGSTERRNTKNVGFERALQELANKKRKVQLIITFSPSTHAFCVPANAVCRVECNEELNVADNLNTRFI